MADNDDELEIALAAMVENGTMEYENLVEEETINSGAEVAVDICSDPLVTVEVETQRNAYSEEGEDDNDEDDNVEEEAEEENSDAYENLVATESMNSGAEVVVDICSEPMVTVETQRNDYSDEDEDDEDDEDEDDSDEDEDVEEEASVEEEEENSDAYEFEDYGNHYRRRRGGRYDDYDLYDDDEYEFVCKKCKTDNDYDYVTLRPTVLTDVPRLTEIASICVAATLWNHVNIPQRLAPVSGKCARNSNQWAIVRSEVLALPNQLPIPTLVAEQIKNHVREMTTKITDWVSYHFRTIFQKNGLDKSVYNHVYHLVWRCNGSINCEETARSMITSVRLSDVEKFKFLATYCVREEIQELSPLVFLNNAMEYVNFSEYPLIVYWYRYFKKQLYKIAVNDSSLSLNAFMFRHENVDNWPAKEYFFNRLSRNKRVRHAIWLINKHGKIYQNAVLSKLDEDQRLRVFMRVGAKIITNCIEPPINSNFILSTWHEIRYFITADKCIHVFRSLLQADVDGTLLTDLWVNTPNELKNYLIYAGNYEIIEKILSSWKWRDSSDFIFVVLEEMHTDTKKGIIKEPFFQTFFEKSLWNGECERLNRILQCCLPELEEIALFKRNFRMKASFTSRCEQIFCWGDYQKLDPVLEFCFPELEENLQFKANFFRTAGCLNRCESLLTSGNYEKLNGMLEVFLPNIEEKVRFKKELLRKSVCVSHCEILLAQGGYQKLDQLLEFCLPEIEENLQFKANFFRTNGCLNRCESFLTSGSYEKLNGMLEVFLPNIEEKVRFKKELLRKSVCVNHCVKLLSQGGYQKLDQVLEFCLPDLEEKRRFKADLIKTFYKNHCEKIFRQEFNTLDRVLEYCLPGIEEKVRFMKDMTDKTFFEKYCEFLLSKMDYERLDLLLKAYFSLAEEIRRFKQNLVFNSAHVRRTCLNYYSSGSTILLNDFLKKVLAPYPDLVTEYKSNLLQSPEAIRKCTDLFASRTDVVSLIIDDTFKDTNQAIAFKKTVIMSGYAISKLKKLLSDGGLNTVISYYNRYLVLPEDKRNLKKLLIDDVVKQIRDILQNNDEKYLRSFILWCYGNDDAVQKFKQTIPLECIFIDLLKEGTFLQYDRLLTNCRFRNRFDPTVVDRFLNWYFESPNDRMQFKMKVIRKYSKFEMFNTLLRKTDVSYLTAIVRWFFQNDVAEIAKFKSIYPYNKISKLI